MTENEAKSYMENEIRCIQRARICDRDCAQCELVKEEEPLIEAFRMAITALEEIQAYRHFGNPKEIEVMVKNLNTVLLRQHDELAKYAKLGTVEELKSLKENGTFSGVELAQLAAMQMRLRDYQAIGTVEECRAVVERMKPKEVKRFKKHDEMLYQCGVCGRDVFSNNDKYCSICGKAIDWSE